MNSLEPWLYSYPAHLHWEQTEPGEFLWGDVTTYACCRESIGKGGPAEQHRVCKEHSSGKDGLTLALKGQNCWMCRLFSLPFLGQWHFRIGSVLSVYRSGVLGWQQNYTHGAPSMKGLSVLVLNKRKGRLAHVFWVSSSVTITLLLSICCNSIKVKNVLFDKKTSSDTLWCIGASDWVCGKRKNILQ